MVAKSGMAGDLHKTSQKVCFFSNGSKGCVTGQKKTLGLLLGIPQDDLFATPLIEGLENLTQPEKYGCNQSWTPVNDHEEDTRKIPGKY